MSDSLVFKLHERQSEALESSATELLYGGAASGGKQVPLTEPVPTPSGWSTIGELKVGDLLFTELGKTCAVTHLHPIDLTPKSTLNITRVGERLLLTAASIAEMLA